MRPPFKDNVAVPLPGLTLMEICPRAGVFNPVAYNSIKADGSIVDVGIDVGNNIYILSTADIETGDLAAVQTPKGLFVRFVSWRADASGKVWIRLEAANPEVTTLEYQYDDQKVRTRWRVVWICKLGDHTGCFPFKRKERKICA